MKLERVSPLAVLAACIIGSGPVHAENTPTSTPKTPVPSPTATTRPTPNAYAFATMVTGYRLSSTPKQYDPKAIATAMASSLLLLSEAEPDVGAAPLSVKFRITDYEDIDIETAKFHWNFDDGTTSEERSPTHVFTKPGRYRVLLKVTDKGASGQDRIDIRVVEATPTPAASTTPATATNSPSVPH